MKPLPTRLQAPSGSILEADAGILQRSQASWIDSLSLILLPGWLLGKKRQQVAQVCIGKHASRVRGHQRVVKAHDLLERTLLSAVQGPPSDP